MDWTNERYVRIYTRDTADLLAVGWQGRLVWFELLRHADRSGVVAAGTNPVVLVELLRIPHEVLEPGLAAVLANGMALVSTEPAGFVIPNYVAAQETPQSGAARMRDLRERRKADRREHAIGSTAERDVSSLERDVSSQIVTRSDAGVTRRDPMPCRAVPDRTGIVAACAATAAERHEDEGGAPPPPEPSGDDQSMNHHRAAGRKRTKKEPLPFTIAELVTALAESSGGFVITEPFDRRLARPLTEAIRSITPRPTLADIAAVGRWARSGLAWMSDRPTLGYFASTGKLADAIAQSLHGRRVEPDLPMLGEGREDQ